MRRPRSRQDNCTWISGNPLTPIHDFASANAAVSDHAHVPLRRANRCIAGRGDPLGASFPSHARLRTVRGVVRRRALALDEPKSDRRRNAPLRRGLTRVNPTLRPRR
jgi:hypothetical protein